MYKQKTWTRRWSWKNRSQNENVMDLEWLQNSYLQRKRRMKPLVLGKLVHGKNSSKGCQLWLSVMGSVCGGCCCCCKKLLWWVVTIQNEAKNYTGLENWQQRVLPYSLLPHQPWVVDWVYSTKHEFPPIEQALSPNKKPICCQNVEKNWPQLISLQTTCVTKGQEHFGRGSGKMVRTRGPGSLLAYTIFLPI